MSGQGCNLHRAHTSANAPATTSTTRNCSILPFWWRHLNVPRWPSRPNQPWWQWQRQFPYRKLKSAPGEIATAPHLNSNMTTASVGSWTTLRRIRTNFGQEASCPAGLIVKASTFIWLGYVCTQILQMDKSHSLPMISNSVGG